MRIFFGCKEWETPFSERVINRVAEVGNGIEECSVKVENDESDRLSHN